jgi:hypothetical protein
LQHVEPLRVPQRNLQPRILGNLAVELDPVVAREQTELTKSRNLRMRKGFSGGRFPLSGPSRNAVPGGTRRRTGSQRPL